MLYRAFDWLTTAAVRHRSRTASVLGWSALLIVGTLFVIAFAAGNVAGSIVFGVLTAMMLFVVMRGVHAAAVARHLDEAAR